MSTSKELVELSELYTNITEKKRSQGGGNQAWRNKGTDKDKEDIKKEDELEKVLTNLKNNKKDDKDDDKEEIKGPNITTSKSNNKSNTVDLTNTTTNNKTKTFHATDRSGRDFDDPGADSDVRGGSKERKPITQDIKGSDGKVVGKKTIHPASDDYQKTFENPKKVDTSKLPSEVTRGKEKEITKANKPDYLGKAQGLLGKDDWLKKTRNSPAASSGAFTDDQRWSTQLKHRQWQKDNNRGKFHVKPEKTKSDTYTTKIGAFLNNKKVGDKKGTGKHTITKIDHNYEEYDAYDLVLNYIMESKQASSIEEANYIMMEMDQNTIHEIVQVQKKSLDEGLAKLVGLGAVGYGLWKAGKWAKKKGDKAIDDARKNMKIGGENRKKEIERKSGVDLSNW